ncbi:MAG: AMP-binding protein [Candidatus Thermoplasmatota archaeon]|nr:AMP-binding protein [Candidatus Thermoplasmatota archaeon]
MTSLLHPGIAYHLLRGYLVDTDRVWKQDREAIERYKSRQFRRMVRYAYDVPVYRRKYRAAGIYPADIRGIEDIKKLPTVSKDDFRKNFPRGIVHPYFDTTHAHLVSTSGSTGQPVSLYADVYTIIKALFGFIRELKEYGVSWRKTRMSVIADIAPHAIEETYLCGSVVPALQSLFSFDNLQILHVGDEPRDLIEKIDAFQPEFLGGYPGVLRALAVLKRKGRGENIKPRVISSSGAVLDDYTKRYIEDTFHAPIFDAYGSTEAGPVAFQCREGNYHIHSDFVHLEFLDETGEEAAPGQPGRVVVTKLYGRGTPVIRYTGMDDILVPLDGTCSCGIHTDMLGTVGGRRVQAIVLPDGEIIPPFSITGIPAKVMKEYGTDKIKQFQMVQESYHRLVMYLVIDEELRHQGPPVQDIKQAIRDKLQQRVGSSMEVAVEEVEHIESEGDLPPTVLISRVST